MTTPHWIGIIGTLLVMAAFVAQIRMLRSNPDSDGLSISANVMGMTSSISLFVYALMQGNLIFEITTGFQIFATVAILALNLKDRKIESKRDA